MAVLLDLTLFLCGAEPYNRLTIEVLSEHTSDAEIVFMEIPPVHISEVLWFHAFILPITFDHLC